jgi:peptidoglycan/xylan/chitin deacetylase (PgdA/CDA1 family)
MSVRHHLHILVAEILYYSGFLAVWRFIRTHILGVDQICVLGLHRVLSDSEFDRSNALPGMMMKQETFVRLLQFVKIRFRVVPIDDMEDAAIGPRCVFTFDDGWKDNYTNAFPWMRKLSIPAIIFVVTGLIGGKESFWGERVVAAWKDPPIRQKLEYAIGVLLNSKSRAVSLRAGASRSSEATLERLIERLKRMPSSQRAQILERLLPANGYNPTDQLMTWQEVAEMSQAGIGFGAHTVTHPLLPYEDQVTAEQEICDSKLVLEQKLQQPVRAFAYPNGDWDVSTRQRVEDAGYKWAFTTRHGWYRYNRDPYTVPRVLLHEGNVTGHTGKFSPAMFTLTTVVSG